MKQSTWSVWETLWATHYFRFINDGEDICLAAYGCHGFCKCKDTGGHSFKVHVLTCERRRRRDRRKNKNSSYFCPVICVRCCLRVCQNLDFFVCLFFSISFSCLVQYLDFHDLWPPPSPTPFPSRSWSSIWTFMAYDFFFPISFSCLVQYLDSPWPMA